MSTYSYIMSQLETALKTYADSVPVTVSWPNRRFVPDGLDFYISTFILPAETATPGLSPSSREDNKGIHQLNVYAKKGTESEGIDVIVDGLLSYFSKATKFGDVFIEKSWASAALDYNDAWYYVPVSIRYRAII